jgi:hypothetical protein
MKKLLLIIMAVAFATFSFSQQISRYVVASGGNYSASSGISLSLTIGEPMVATFTGMGLVLTQGFQQPSTTSGCTDSVSTNYNPLAIVDDGSCLYCVDGCTDPTAVNYDSLATCDDGSCIAFVYGCTDPTALNYYAGANSDDGTCAYVAGCTDATACNYDPLADFDDGSCSGIVDFPTNLQLQTAFDVQAWVEWDEMSSVSDSVDFYKVLYRAVGDTTWLIKQKTYAGNQSPIVKVRLQFLTASTLYEMKIKAGYNSGCISEFSPISYFTTADECPNVTNFLVSTPKSTKAVFSWDTTGTYSFLRVKLRVDSISNPTGADWQNAGGFGVFYPITSKTKNGLVPGETYRAQARTWCDPNGGPYRSTGWTPLIFWTQPVSVRLEGGAAINNLAIYPNPSRDIFNVSFISEDNQNLKVKILNVVGEVIISEDLEQFIGEYTKQINLTNNAKGIYFLEIETEDGVVNKKLILQ